MLYINEVYCSFLLFSICQLLQFHIYSIDGAIQRFNLYLKSFTSVYNLFQRPEDGLSTCSTGENLFNNTVPFDVNEQSNSLPGTEAFPPLDSPQPPDDLTLQNSPLSMEVFSPPNSPPPPEYFSPPPSPTVALSPANIVDQDMPCEDFSCR